MKKREHVTKAAVSAADRLLDIENKCGDATYVDGSLLDDIHWLIQEVKQLRTRNALVRKALHVYNDEREGIINLSHTFWEDATALQKEAAAEGFSIWDSLDGPPEKTP